MLIAKMKMSVSMTMTLPLVDTPKETAQAEFDKPGAKEALSHQLFESVRASMGSMGTIDLADVEIELVEI